MIWSLAFFLLICGIIFWFLRKEGLKGHSAAAGWEAARVRGSGGAAVTGEAAGLGDVQPGDVITVSGFGDEFEDVNFTVEKLNRYETTSSAWHEILGRYKEKRIWLEWEMEDGRLFITATQSREGMSLPETGCREEDLIRFDSEGSTSNFFTYHNKKFMYVKSGEVTYFEDNRDTGTGGFYLWDFISDDSKEVISIEKWEGEPFRVYSGIIIPEFNVTLFKKSRPSRWPKS